MYGLTLESGDCTWCRGMAMSAMPCRSQTTMRWA